jgi:hypothetical protein
MRVQAKLITASHIHKSWRSQGRIGGEIHGVYFKLRTNREYVSDEVPPHLLQRLNGHRHVQLEIMSEPTLIDIKLEPEVSPFIQPIIPLPEPVAEEVVEAPEEVVETPEEVVETPKRRGRPPKAA